MIFFNRKPKPTEPKTEQKSENSSLVAKAARPVSKAPEGRPVSARSGLGEQSTLLKAPHITEKATALAQDNKYVFKVAGAASKSEIKKAIENIYKAKVIKVGMINSPAKPKRFGKFEGWQKGYKKAVVTLREGEKIEVLPR